jgi:hypothetical protein
MGPIDSLEESVSKHNNLEDGRMHFSRSWSHGSRIVKEVSLTLNTACEGSNDKRVETYEVKIVLAQVM